MKTAVPLAEEFGLVPEEALAELGVCPRAPVHGGAGQGGRAGEEKSIVN